MTEQHSSKEEVNAYDRWFCEQIRQSMENSHPLTPHEEVIAELRKALEKIACAAAGSTPGEVCLINRFRALWL